MSVARDGREALELLDADAAAAGEAGEVAARGSVDLILTDILMPHLSGLQLLASLQREAFSHIPVIGQWRRCRRGRAPHGGAGRERAALQPAHPWPQPCIT